MKFLQIFIFAIAILALSVSYVFAAPSGATVTSESNDTAGTVAAGSHAAIAGNLTEITLSGDGTTQSWQAFYGNVSGSIRLADSSNNVIYNWSLASPQGEVYASNASSITWSSIDCNTGADDYEGLEGDYGLSPNDADGVNETFNLNNHPEFFTGTVQHTAGECNNTQLFDSGGAGSFYEVILTDSTNTVYASILQEDGDGFDGVTHDFQMIVLEDGHSGDTSTTTYFFWVELE